MKTFPRPHRFLMMILPIIFIAIMATVSVKAQNTGVTATVSAQTVSLQSGPGLNFSSLGTAHLGDTFAVLGRASGSNRVWYEIQLHTGGTAWVSERIVTIYPSPDSLPWLGPNTSKTPLLMDCGRFEPVSQGSRSSGCRFRRPRPSGPSC